jgi:mannose-6-phosphate isomerase-like protein (cupin superfamily)
MRASPLWASNGETFPITRCDSFVVRPGHEHVVENPNDERLYCLMAIAGVQTS